MNLSPPTTWWIATGVLVAAELASGTFYLLMLAIGTVAAALAAQFGLGLAGQFVAAAAVGGSATLGWYLKNARQSGQGSNRDGSLDVGGRVTVEHWQDDGTARISYRGTNWSARYAGTGAPLPGRHVIRALDGNELLLERLPAPA